MIDSIDDLKTRIIDEFRQRLEELEEENRKLKQMYAELALDNKILKGVIEKNLEPEVKKELADEIVKEYNVSISRACKLMDIHRSYFYYTEKKDDSEVEQAIREAAEKFVYIHSLLAFNNNFS